MNDMPDIQDKRSLKDHGAYSAYCKLCWEPVYILWVDAAAPEGCAFDLDKPDACPNAAYPKSVRVECKQ